MNQKNLTREVQDVVDRVLPLVPTKHAVAKADFEIILGEIRTLASDKTQASLEKLNQATSKVLADMPKEYGQLEERERSWSTLIAYLYVKLLTELSAA